ncbi:MAG TPA: DUF389 domain-containing protein [Nocardioides sp.]|nr:DUF389 domain-containing protein [Nocardioides sp.]
MLHLQLRVPADRIGQVVDLLRSDDTVTNVVVVEDAYVKPEGHLVLADVAREGANPVVAQLHRLGLHHDGVIMLTEPATVLSDEADRAEQAAPGDPDDSVVWDVVENRLRSESRLNVSFVGFLTLATLIAGVGRYLDQPILIVGAMVVGPEFAPVAAVCLGLARPRLSLLPTALRTLAVGFGVAVVAAALLWLLGSVSGLVTPQQAATGDLTRFIVEPDHWSLIVALLAGIAGMLSLTTSKSGPLVGVFISVTTVPSVGTFALCLGTGTWSDLGASAAQLGVNVAGLLVAGTLTLLVQRLVWGRLQRPGKAHALADRGA